MKKSLLATVAAVALIAGTGLASAESAKERAGAAPAGHSEMNRGAGADIKGGAAVKGQAQTTGSGASEMRAEPKAEMKSGAETKGRAETKGKAGSKAEMNKAKPSTTGAGPSEEKSGSKAGSASEMKSGTEMKSKSGTEMKSGTQSPSAAERNSSTTTAQGSASAQGSVNLTSEQKTKIRTTVIEKGGAPKVSRSSINFNISVGTVVPRTVHFVAVPSTLVEIHPAWRGFEYFVVDEEIIIIDPHTLKIVAVLDV